MTSKHTKKCSASVVIREMQMKMTTRYLCRIYQKGYSKRATPPGVEVDVEKLDPSPVAAERSRVLLLQKIAGQFLMKPNKGFSQTQKFYSWAFIPEK